MLIPHRPGSLLGEEPALAPLGSSRWSQSHAAIISGSPRLRPYAIPPEREQTRLPHRSVHRHLRHGTSGWAQDNVRDSRATAGRVTMMPPQHAAGPRGAAALSPASMMPRGDTQPVAAGAPRVPSSAQQIPLGRELADHIRHDVAPVLLSRAALAWGTRSARAPSAASTPGHESAMPRPQPDHAGIEHGRPRLEDRLGLHSIGSTIACRRRGRGLRPDTSSLPARNRVGLTIRQHRVARLGQISGSTPAWGAAAPRPGTGPGSHLVNQPGAEGAHRHEESIIAAGPSRARSTATATRIYGRCR